MKFCFLGTRSRIAVLAVLAITALVPVVGHGDIVIMHDGTTLRGTVRREGTIYTDVATSQKMWMPAYGGFFMVDDGARRVVFPTRQVREARADPTEKQIEAFFTPKALFLSPD